MNQGLVAGRVPLGRETLLAEAAGPGLALLVNGGPVALQSKDSLEAQGAVVAGVGPLSCVPVLQPAEEDNELKHYNQKN